ncbi:MAG: uracil-DNA glycosylase family protein [candidate division WOR-3 bacterium]
METTKAQEAEKALVPRRLAARMRRCRKCCGPAGVHPVFGQFLGQRWMLVGQAPGVTELVANRPFAGSAGKRLFSWLGRAGFAEEQFRSSCYITAVMKCFPGKGARGDLKPNQQQLANCAPWLEQELTLVRPEVLIPVGQMAIERFLGKVRLDEVVGKRFIRKVGGRKVVVIPLPHPSGASVWLNRPESQERVNRALQQIGRLFTP